MAHNGVSSTSLRSCVKAFANRTYSFVASQVKQAKSTALLPLGILIAMTPVEMTSPAYAVTAYWGTDPREEANFFDFERAKSYWMTLRTRQDIEVAYSSCEKEPYVGWEAKYRRASDRAALLNALERRTDKEAQTIKICYDFDVMFDVWSKVVNAKARAEGATEWNKADENDDWCKWAAHYNLFTGTCNNLPDWRAPK